MSGLSLFGSGLTITEAQGPTYYLGTWDASTNTPTLVSSTAPAGPGGSYYIVSVAGTTNLNGITDWTVGDWVIWSGSVWQKLEGGMTSVTVGSTQIAGGTSGRVLYDNAGVLGEMTNTGTGTVNVLQTSPALITPALGIATGTSLALGGATIGSNALAVTGTAAISGGATILGSTAIGSAPFSPNASLEVRDVNGSGYAETRMVSNAAAPANFIAVYHNGEQGYIEAWRTAGQATIDISPKSQDLASAQLFSLFRNSPSGGLASFRIYKGNGTNAVQSLFGGFDNTFINALAGSVGIGFDTSPASNLEIRSPTAAAVALRLAADATNYSTFTRGISGGLSIVERIASGDGALNLDFTITDGTSTGYVNFFRNTTTTNAVGLKMYKGDGTSATNTQLTGNTNSYINGLVGKVGIGFQASPVGNLEVRSNAASTVDLRLAADTSNYSSFIRGASGGLSIVERIASGSGVLNVDFTITDGTSTGYVNFFRNTTTTNVAALKIFKADGTSATNTQLSGNTATFLNTLVGSVVVGTTIATNATTGFLYIPGGAGPPTGAPTAYTGTTALYFDQTNDQLYIYRGGWKQPKTPAGASIVTWQ